MEQNDNAAANQLLRDLLMPQRGNSHANANFSINAGGVGVWVACTCCLIMLAVLIVGGLWLSREFNRIDAVVNDLNDKDSVHDAYIQKLNNAQKASEKK